MGNWGSDREGRDRTTAELVVDAVRGQIERGQLRAGQRLPPEREFAARLGVSRPSVRTGLRTLATMGIVRTRHGYFHLFNANSQKTVGAHLAHIFDKLDVHSRVEAAGRAHQFGMVGRDRG